MPAERITRLVAAVGALAAWFALGLQLTLLVEPMGGLGPALWRFLGYFTLLTNIGVALVLTHTALWPHRRSGLGDPRVVFSVTVAILLVGIVYAVALRALWDPQGLAALSDNLLHVATPAICLVFCVLRLRGEIDWKDALWALAWPLGYLIYALGRGAADGWYAYWFLNPTQQPLGELAISVSLLLLGVLVIAQTLAAFLRLFPARR